LVFSFALRAIELSTFNRMDTGHTRPKKVLVEDNSALLALLNDVVCKEENIRKEKLQKEKSKLEWLRARKKKSLERRQKKKAKIQALFSTLPQTKPKQRMQSKQHRIPNTAPTKKQGSVSKKKVRFSET